VLLHHYGVSLVNIRYVDGKDIGEKVQSQGGVTQIELCKYVKQILEALNYSHKKSIAHWDLKDENILITKDGTVKIIDFGFSKNFNVMQMSTVCGSPIYIAPEVIKSKYNMKCDLWSLGIMIYILFSQ